MIRYDISNIFQLGILKRRKTGKNNVYEVKTYQDRLYYNMYMYVCVWGDPSIVRIFL